MKLFFGEPKNNSLLYMTSGFYILAVLSGQKGVFWPFFQSKIETQLSEHLRWEFLTGSNQTTFFGTQKQFLALTDERFSNFGRSKRTKRRILAVFWVKKRN
jgi:hypothetical protein